MGVSADTGVGLDMNLVIEGGPGFITRLTQLAAAKKEHDDALKALHKGQEVVALREEAANLRAEAAKALAEAKAEKAEKLGALELEIAKIKSDVNAWAEQTKEDIMARLRDAQANLDVANSMKESAEAKQAAALTIYGEAKEDADTILADAHAQAKEIVADADKRAAKAIVAASNAQNKAEYATAEAAATKKKYDDAIALLKGL